MTISTKQLSPEKLPLLPTVQTTIPNPYQPTGKWRWFVASVVSFGGAGGVGYISVKNFIAKTVVEGGILGAGSLICAGACVYCVYRFFNALTTRNIEPITFVDEEPATTLALTLRPIHNQLNRLLNQNAVTDLEQCVDDRRLHESINQQLTELEKSHTRNNEPITAIDVSTDNALLLRTIDDRLKIVLNIETEAGLELHESINQQLAYLEELLPNMNQQLLDLQKAIQDVILNRFTGSQNTTGPNSPSADSSRENDLFAKLDTWAQQVAKDQLSRNNSRLHSVYSSPTAGGNSSVTFTSTAKSTPIRPTSRTIEKQRPPRLNLEAINGSESDSEDGKK